MPKKSRKSVRNHVTIIVVLLIVGAAWGVIRFGFKAQPVQVFLVENVPLELGDTQISGVILKDQPLGIEGKYILSLDDYRVVALDIKDGDHYVGKKVRLYGYVSENLEENMLNMKVNKIEAIE